MPRGEAYSVDLVASQSAAFTAAIKELSALYQLSDESSPPLVLSSTPLFQLEHAAPLGQATPAAHELASAGPFIHYRGQNLINRPFYFELASIYQKHLIKDWVPHVMTKREIEAHRKATLQALESIRRIEDQVERFLPNQDRNLEQVLFMMRLDFRTRFYRIFRMNDLPVEILTNIFNLVVWTAPTSQAAISWRINLTSICRSWRNLAISVPFLWNAVWITDPFPFERSLTWIERAGNADLDVRFNDSEANPLTLEGARYLFDKIFAKLSTIRSLIIMIRDLDPALYVLDVLRQVAPTVTATRMVLRHFELHRSGSAYILTGNGFAPEFYTKPIPIFGGVDIPSLGYMAINGVHIDFQNIAMSNLTVLDIRRIPIEKCPTLTQFRHLLASSPNLEKLVLDGTGPQWPNDAELPLGTVVLLNLRHLVVGDMSMNYAAYVLSLITAPNVITLVIINLLGEGYHTFFPMLEKFPLIKALTLHTRGWDDQCTPAVVHWLQTLKEVVFLRVSDLDLRFLNLFLYDANTMQLATGPGKHVLCPKLVVLECHNIDLEILFSWIPHRHLLGSTVRKIYIGEATLKSLGSTRFTQIINRLPTLRPSEVSGLPRNNKTIEEQILLANGEFKYSDETPTSIISHTVL